MNQPNFSIRIRTVWFCVFWQLTMQMMWHCRSTSPCCSPSAATAASTSCEYRGFRDSNSCSVPWTPTETRKSKETSTACWLRIHKLTTADYKKWGPTARRVDAWTSGFLSWSCRNADRTGDPIHEQKLELSGFKYLDSLLPMLGQPAVHWDTLS